MAFLLNVSGKMKLKYFLLIVLLVIIDQLTKYFFGFVKNTGAAFGILQGYNFIFILVSFAALIGFGFYFVKNDKDRLACSLILAGIIGNLIDRIFFGYVRDFIDLRIWPVFNLADAAMVVGVGLLVIGMFKKN